jgi:NAD(P)H dehydrogenase (quinone)
MNPRILVVIGTPLSGSLTHALAASYVEAARDADADIRVVDLAHDPIPAHPTHRDELRMPRTADDRPLDPVAAAYIDDVRWADHLVFFYPQWWGTYPGALKSFIDRVFLAGFAFRYRATGRFWDRLLIGRTARIVMTMDSPRAWNRLKYRNASETSLKVATLGYCGIKTVGTTRFAEVRHRDQETRERWVAETARLGRADAAASVTRTRDAVLAPL